MATDHIPQASEKTRLLRPYAPSWVDLLTDWIRGLAIPSWSFYLSAYLLLALLYHGIAWLDEIVPPWRIDPIIALFTGWLVYPLAMMHYLDELCEGALDAFRPALDLDQVGFARLRYQLSTMPFLPVLASNLMVMGLTWLSLQTEPAQRVLEPYLQSPILAIAAPAGLYLAYGSTGGLVYHTVRQLQLVSRIYGEARYLNLFQSRSTYAFSGLTAYTGVGWIFLVYMGLLIVPELRQIPAWIGISSAIIMLLLVFFLATMVHIHRRIVEEKDLLLAQVNQRLEQALHNLHDCIDAGKLGELEQLQAVVTSQVQERDLLAKLPTWPWPPGTLAGFLSTLLIPVVIWMLQQLAQRILAF